MRIPEAGMSLRQSLCFGRRCHSQPAFGDYPGSQTERVYQLPGTKVTTVKRRRFLSPPTHSMFPVVNESDRRRTVCLTPVEHQMRSSTSTASERIVFPFSSLIWLWRKTQTGRVDPASVA